MPFTNETQTTRKPLVFIIGVSGSGKITIAHYVAQKQPSVDLRRQEIANAAQVSFNGDAPVDYFNKKWFGEGKFDLPVIARLLFQQSAAPNFRVFCRQFDSALTINELDRNHIDQITVLETICDIHNPAILIMDELSKLRHGACREHAPSPVRRDRFSMGIGELLCLTQCFITLGCYAFAKLPPLILLQLNSF